VYLDYEQVAATAVVQGVDALTIPPGANFAELQSDTNHIRYTMTAGNPAPTIATGMLLLTTERPKSFLLADLLRIQFVRDGAGGVDGNLNIHYYTGREI